jgi:hypothetical protein
MNLDPHQPSERGRNSLKTHDGYAESDEDPMAARVH